VSLTLHELFEFETLAVLATYSIMSSVLLSFSFS